MFFIKSIRHIKHQLHLIIMNEAEQLKALKDLSAQADKIALEQSNRAIDLQKAIDKLKELLAAGSTVGTAVAEAIVELQEKFQKLDDTIPDVVVPDVTDEVTANGSQSSQPVPVV